MSIGAFRKPIPGKKWEERKAVVQFQISESQFLALSSQDGQESDWTGGPLKPGFGLSGAVLALDKVFPQLVRVFAPSILTDLDPPAQPVA